MKKNSWIKAGLTCILFFFSLTGRAQDGRLVKARLDTVAKTGFYRIVLPPAFVALCRPDLSDLRIFNSGGEQVPYVLRTDIDDSLNAGWLSLPDPTITRKDSSNKHSYYRLRYDNTYRIERLSFVISNPVLYKRTVGIIAAGDPGAVAEPVTYVSVDPHDTAFRIPATRSRVLVIDIANGDNAPLDITRVASAQSGIYLLTWFVAFTDGYILEGGKNWPYPPDYDLHYFTDSLRRRPFDIGLKDIRVEEGGDKADGAGAGRRSGLLLWSILIVLLLLLTYVSVKLARSVSQKEKNDRL